MLLSCGHRFFCSLLTKFLLRNSSCNIRKLNEILSVRFSALQRVSYLPSIPVVCYYMCDCIQIQSIKTNIHERGCGRSLSRFLYLLSRTQSLRKFDSSVLRASEKSFSQREGFIFLLHLPVL